MRRVESLFFGLGEWVVRGRWHEDEQLMIASLLGNADRTYAGSDSEGNGCSFPFVVIFVVVPSCHSTISWRPARCTLPLLTCAQLGSRRCSMKSRVLLNNSWGHNLLRTFKR